MTDAVATYAYYVYIPILYMALVVAPGLVRYVIEAKLLGVPAEAYERVWWLAGWWRHDAPPLPAGAGDRFSDFVLTVLFYPLFEELLFRYLPLQVWGEPGLLYASAVWVLMHPAWQLALVEPFLDSTRDKVLYVAGAVLYYAPAAVFYDLLWLWGLGWLALVIHTLHNLSVLVASWRGRGEGGEELTWIERVA